MVASALAYDVRRGAHSVGAHVRDAAAYVCWALARAYGPEVLGAWLPTLAPPLLTAAVFDREVHCRRAAAAAFQESVGRLGSFPHGIELVTVADYFTVGVRAHAFTVVAPQVRAVAVAPPPSVSPSQAPSASPSVALLHLQRRRSPPSASPTRAVKRVEFRFAHLSRDTQSRHSF